jgi:hypothetical protein
MGCTLEVVVNVSIAGDSLAASLAKLEAALAITSGNAIAALRIGLFISTLDAVSGTILQNDFPIIRKFSVVF